MFPDDRSSKTLLKRISDLEEELALKNEELQRLRRSPAPSPTLSPAPATTTSPTNPVSTPHPPSSTVPTTPTNSFDVLSLRQRSQERMAQIEAPQTRMEFKRKYGQKLYDRYKWRWHGAGKGERR